MPKTWQLNTKKEKCPHCEGLALRGRGWIKYTWPPLKENEMAELKKAVRLDRRLGGL